MTARQERLQRFEALLQQLSPSSSPKQVEGGASTVSGTRGQREEVDHRVHEELRMMCLQGIPDKPPALRPRLYSSLLSLPPLPSSTSQYSAFLAEVSSRVTALPAPSSSATPERYDRLLREIERDVERTFGALAWFGAEVGRGEGRDAEGEQGDAFWERIGELDEEDRRQARELAEKEGEKGRENGDATAVASNADISTPSVPTTPTRGPLTRRQTLLQPLFIHAFLNPGIGYVQGMSYLAAVLFYVFSSPVSPSSSPPTLLDAQSATFFALSALLSQLRDLYTPTLDGVGALSPRLTPHGHGRTGSAGIALPTGLGATVVRFNALLMAMDPNVAEALERKGVELGGMAIRWWTTMFANEFTLPDVVRIWDRLLSLFPPENEDQPAEALSPLLGHLIDLSIALVLLERSKILSPFSRLPEILTALQSPSADVDRLLQSAWDVRERRLGHKKHGKSDSVSSAGAASPAKSVFNLGKKFWSGIGSVPTTPTKNAVNAAVDFELDDQSSLAGSDNTRPRFGSLAFSSPRSSQDLTGNVTVVDGKVLPPPPARIDEHPTIASLIEEELAAEQALRSPDEDEYGVEDDEAHNSLAKKATSGWGGLKSSFSRFAASDTAANLSKRATNLQLAAANASTTASSRFQSSDAAAALYKAQTNAAIKAQILRDQLAQEGPEKLAKIREAATEAHERLLGSTGSERAGDLRLGNPRETPFTPPGGNRVASPLSSPRIGASSSLSGSVDMGRQESNGPKPLLLSASARRAEKSEDSPSTTDTPISRRTSLNWGRAGSHSPVATRTPLLSPDLTIPPLSRSPSRTNGIHGRSASHFDAPTPSRTNPAASFRPRSSSVAQNSPREVQEEDEPINPGRVYDPSSAVRRGTGTSRAREDGSPVPSSVSARPAAGVGGGGGGARGWQLSDAPLRSSSSASTPRSYSPSQHEAPRVELPSLDLGFDPGMLSSDSANQRNGREEETVSTSRPSTLSRSQYPSSRITERPFVPPTEAAFSPPTETAFSPPTEMAFSPPTETAFSPPTERAFSPPTERAFSPPIVAQQHVVSPTNDLPPRQSSLHDSVSSSTAAPPRTSSLSSSVLPPALSAPTSSSNDPSPATSESEDPSAPLSTQPSLSRSKLVRRPVAVRKRTSRSAASVDLTGADARRVASEFLTRSGSGRSVASSSNGGSLHRSRQSESGGGGGSRLSRAEFDEEDFLEAYGGGSGREESS